MRQEITTLEALDALDDDELVEGYRDGHAGFPCGDNRSDAYWHGWRNGMVDSKRADSTPAHGELVAKYVVRSNARAAARSQTPPPPPSGPPA